MAKILCINGPNLDRLGERQPEVYGKVTLPELERTVTEWGEGLGLEVECLHSNFEGEIVEAIHAARGGAGLLINPGALTHSSPGLGDAIAAAELPVAEVHISNVRGRERWRRRSFTGATTAIFGRGIEGYRSGLRALANRVEMSPRTVRYGPHPDQVVDIWGTGSSTFGVLALHGGFWLDTWGRDTMETWAAHLALKGLPTANVEYRRLGSGGGAVATTSDVAEAIERSRHDLDVDRVIVMGHSAGAHLGTWALSSAGFRVHGFIGLAGIFDLDMVTDGPGREAGDRFDPGRVTSPVAAPSAEIPMVLVHGAEDDLVTASQSLAYGARTEAASVETVDGAGHFDLLNPLSSAGLKIDSHLHEMMGSAG